MKYRKCAEPQEPHANSKADQGQSASIVDSVFEEINLHIDFCAEEFGLSEDDLRNTEESQGMF